MYIDEHGRTVLVGQEALDGFVKKISRLMENRKLHYRTTFQDLPISVENRKSSIRRGKDSDGDEWETKMKVPYGYIPGTEGADGDGVDCFVGPQEDAAYAYVIHCNDPESGEFDEDKVMLGFESADSAKRVFLQHYDDPKFFGGIDSIPMWKFRDLVWVKKQTTKKLVAAVRESKRFQESAVGIRTVIDGIPLFIFVRTGNKQPVATKDGNSSKTPTIDQGYIPAGMYASGSLTRETVREVKKNYGGQAHIFTSRRGMKKAILGHHQDVMLDPRVREHGTKGQRWGIRSPKEIIEYAGGEYKGSMESPNKGTLHMFNDPSAKHQSTLAMYDKDITDPQAVRDKMDSKKREFGEAREHGVKGMKWGVRHVRKDAAGQKHPTTGKPQHAMRRDLAKDPKTMSMMQHVSKGQSALAHYNATRQQQQAQGQKVSPPKDAHNEALGQLVKGLGWKVAGAVARMTGFGGAFQQIQSLVRAPSGQKMTLNTDSSGNHSLRNSSGGKRTRTSVRESRPFEERLGRFLREAKKSRIYYARSLQHYGTSKESDSVDTLQEAYPDSSIFFPKTRRHAQLGMEHFHKQIDKAKEVVIEPLRKNRVTAGVFSEAQHALHKGKKVRMLVGGKLRTVKRLSMIENGQPDGEYARVILKKKKKGNF
jgi:inorganic pyrophosphatase-like protein